MAQCPLQLGTTECGYYVMRYMRDIITKGGIVITDLVCVYHYLHLLSDMYVGQK